MSGNSVSISLLVHSRHQNQRHSFYTRVIYTFTIIQHRDKRIKASLGWEGRRKGGRREECSLKGGGGTLVTAMNWIYSKNMQSIVGGFNIDHKCFGTTSVIGIKAKLKKVIWVLEQSFQVRKKIVFRTGEKHDG